MRTFRWVLFKEANLLSTFTFTIERSIRGNNQSSNRDFQHFPFFLINSYTLNPSILFIKMPQIKYFNVKQINNSEITSCNVWLKPCPFNPTVLNFLQTSDKCTSALCKSFIIPYFEIVIFPRRQYLTFHANWFLIWDNLHEMSNYVLR